MKIPVHKFIKKIITSLQITQLFIGISYALGHIFYSYSYLSEVPYFETVLKDTAPTTTSSVADVATSTSFSEKVKNLLISSLGRSSVAVQEEAILPEFTKQVRSRTEKITLNCLDTSGQHLAILLNVAYLIPLIFLFLHFYSKEYLRPKKISDRGHTEKDKIFDKVKTEDKISETIKKEIEREKAE